MSVDPYFLPEYAVVNEPLEGGRADTFRYTGPEGVVEYSFLIRPVDAGTAGEEVRDIISPYGYGGPSLRPRRSCDLPNLAKAFEVEFTKYCMAHRVVTEFVRFHPLESNADHLTNMYDVRRSRPTVITDLHGDGVLDREFSKGARKSIRRVARAGITVKTTETPQSVLSLQRLYRLTMDRNQAADFYYFTDDYFERLLGHMRDQLVLFEAYHNGEVIAAAICLFGGGRIHIHLSGTDSNYLALSPAYSLRNAIVEWGIESDMDVVHHGGGRTDALDDSLYLYKRQFGSQTTTFYTGRRILDPRLYAALCSPDAPPESESDFFPAYRRKGWTHGTT